MKKNPNPKTKSLQLPFRAPIGEKLLQFIWQFGYYNKASLATTDGLPITILSPGTLNKNQGPDFTNARIRLDDTILAGTIELHTRTSEWRRHQHETDEHYNNVVLHVVYEHDEAVNDIPVLELSSRISNLLIEKYTSLMDNASFIPCGSSIATVSELVLASWKERLLVERLARKANHILDLFEKSNHHWEEVFWWIVARNFGSKTNGEAFEALARTIPINILAKHKSSIHQLEALLFGQANLLHGDFDDAYPILLKREYEFLKKKYNLSPAVIPVLFLRMRPGNFPTIRLAQLAMLIHQTSHLFSKIREADSLTTVKASLEVTANDFWHYHYNFRETSPFKKKSVGTDMINNLVINSVVPILFSYGLYHNDEKYNEKALQWLEELPPEVNQVTGEFVKIGLKNKSAYDSQALLELKNVYCNEKQCLRCSAGNYLLREAAHPYNGSNNAG